MIDIFDDALNTILLIFGIRNKVSCMRPVVIEVFFERLNRMEFSLEEEIMMRILEELMRRNSILV